MKLNLQRLFQKRKNGFNIHGYFTGESGMGQLSRAMRDAIKAANIPYKLINIDKTASRQDFIKLENTEIPDKNINLFVVNADTIGKYVLNNPEKIAKTKYNIAYWAWELEEFPAHLWQKDFDFLDEIWALSEFAAKSISSSVDKPVFAFDPPVEFSIKKELTRKDLDLPEDKFIFLFSFDFLSHSPRKNPEGVINAFRKAFKNNEDVMLVLKFSNSKFKLPYKGQLYQTFQGLKNIKIIDDYLSRDEMYNLINLSDCYVSLHRAEGFGFGMAEAMYLGRPVIATGYSGNMDFMNSKNSFPVKYEVTKIKETIGPYQKGMLWAEPDINDAARKMKYVFENQIKSKKVAQVGQNYVQTYLSAEHIGSKILERCENITKHI